MTWKRPLYPPTLNSFNFKHVNQSISRGPPYNFKCLEALEQYLAVSSPEVHIHLQNYHPQDTIDRFMTRYAMHVNFDQPQRSMETAEIRSQPFCRLSQLRLEQLGKYETLDVAELGWMQLIISRTHSNVIGVEQAIGDKIRQEILKIPDDNNPASGDGTETTPLGPPQRLSRLTFDQCDLASASWSQMVLSIDVLTLNNFRISRCRSFTDTHLTELVTRCISVKGAFVVPLHFTDESTPPSLCLSPDTWALHDFKNRVQQRLVVSLLGTGATEDLVEIEKDRLRDKGIDWVRITP